MTEGESLAAYRRLAEFRHQIRQFLHISEQAARAQGIEPKMHQALLAIKGLPEGAKPTVTALALRLCLKPHSVVEMVNRLAERGFAARRRGQEDRREVLIEVTPLGEEVLEKLKDVHLQELQIWSPELCRALQAVIDNPPNETCKARAGTAH